MPTFRHSYRGRLVLAVAALGSALTAPALAQTCTYDPRCLNLDLRVAPGSVGIEPACGAAPPRLPLAVHSLGRGACDGRRSSGGFSPTPSRAPVPAAAAADPAPGG